MFVKLYWKELTENSDSIGNALDVIFCTIRYGASPVNYKMFGFDKLTAKQRRTYVTNRISRKMIRKYNKADFIDMFENKAKFAEVFAEYFGRRWILTDALSREVFHDFLSKIGGQMLFYL